MSDAKDINLPTKEEIHKLMYDTAHIERKKDHVVVRWEFAEEAEALSNMLEESRKKIASILKEKDAEIDMLKKKATLNQFALDVAVKERDEQQAEIERLRGLLKKDECVHPYSCIDFREYGDNYCKACGEKLT